MEMRAGQIRLIGSPIADSDGEALPLPDKPSVAVLAFTNMSGDPGTGISFRRNF